MLISQFVADALYAMPGDPVVTEVTQELCRNHGVECDCDLNIIHPQIAQKIMTAAEEKRVPQKRRAGFHR